MKIVREELNYFQEVGAVLNIAKKLEEKGIFLTFDEHGIRVSTLYSKEVRQEYFYTAEELKSYLLGIEDGFWSAPIRDDLFEEPKK